jgi:hypothetical protein
MNLHLAEIAKTVASVIKSFGTFGGKIDWRIWRIC